MRHTWISRALPHWVQDTSIRPFSSVLWMYFLISPFLSFNDNIRIFGIKYRWLRFHNYSYINTSLPRYDKDVQQPRICIEYHLESEVGGFERPKILRTIDIHQVMLEDFSLRCLI